MTEGPRGTVPDSRAPQHFAILRGAGRTCTAAFLMALASTSLASCGTAPKHSIALMDEGVPPCTPLPGTLPAPRGAPPSHLRSPRIATRTFRPARRCSAQLLLVLAVGAARVATPATAHSTVRSQLVLTDSGYRPSLRLVLVAIRWNLRLIGLRSRCWQRSRIPKPAANRRASRVAQGRRPQGRMQHPPA